MIFAPINRFHIMDISQERSVVKRLLSEGLDVYLLDWGYPGWEDSSLSLTDYVNYVRDAIEDIKDKTGKITRRVLCILLDIPVLQCPTKPNSSFRTVYIGFHGL